MKKTLLLSLALLTLVLGACQGNSERDWDKDSDEDQETSDRDDRGMDHMMGGGMMMDDEGMNMMLTSEEDFLALMIPHHQEAVDTAKIILEKSTNKELRSMAQDIVSTQTEEIAQMEVWGKEWYGEDFKASDDYEAMMPDLTKLEGDELDRAFIEGMIEHHKMAIMMAQHVKMLTDREELLTMAEAIIEAQSKEIETMEGWLN